MRTAQFINITQKPVVLVVVILICAHAPLRELLTHTIFIDADDETRLRRMTTTYIHTRGRTVDEVNQRFRETILPMHNAHIEPFKSESDYVFDNNKDDLSRLGSFCKLVSKLIK